MGGRGSAGGEGLRSRLPGPLSFDIKTYEYPELSGTDKQVKWANDIREKLLFDLANYAANQNSEGQITLGISDIYLKGKAAMAKDIKSNPLVMATSGLIKAEKISRAIRAFSEVKSRIERWHDLAEKKSASFWIENRTNSSQNYMNKKLMRYIDGK